MYKKDAHGKNVGEKEKIKLEGSVDQIFTTKVNGMLPDRIVVIASAGKGKTTAVAKMAYDWAYHVQGSPFEKLPLLFILRLRDVCPGMSFGQAIIEQLLSDVTELTSQALEKFIRKNQKLCWVILDGLDEFSGSMSPGAVLTSNIINVITNKHLPNCRVLVTTRPHLESEFEQDDLPQIYAKMEIEGFSTENSRQYFEKFFCNDTVTGNELMDYLKEHDVINELVSTPLFCVMVCYLWRENLLVGIDTQTQLFDSVNLFLLHHSKGRTSKYTPERLSRIVHQLGKVALEGLVSGSKKFVFRSENFEKIPEVVQDGCELGIISVTTSDELYDKFSKEYTHKPSIEFYHKLAQEHAAGKYLAMKSTKIKMKLHISKLDIVMSRIRTTRESILSHEHLLRFASGTKNDVCCKIINEILANNILDVSERSRIILDCSCESPGLEGNVSSVVRGCVKKGSVVLKSPTVFTVVGIKKLPESLKKQV